MKGPKNHTLTFAQAAPDASLRRVAPSAEMQRLMERPQRPATPQRHQPATAHVPGSVAYGVLGGQVIR